MSTHLLIVIYNKTILLCDSYAQWRGKEHICDYTTFSVYYQIFQNAVPLNLKKLLLQGL